jgi:hypothetical protein
MHGAGVAEVGEGAGINGAEGGEGGNNSKLIWVEPQRVGFIKGSRWLEVVTPQMYIADSAIPSLKKWAAKGVMFGENVRKGTIVGLYGGPPVSRQYALEVVRQTFWMDDHLQKVGPQNGGFVHDGRVTDKYPIEYYAENGLAGSLVNDACGTDLPYNVAVEFYDGHYMHPDGQVVDVIAVFRTIKDCQVGDEVLRDYGPTHRKCHFDLTAEERQDDLVRALYMPPPNNTLTARGARAENYWANLHEPFKLGKGSMQRSRVRAQAVESQGCEMQGQQDETEAATGAENEVVAETPEDDDADMNGEEGFNGCHAKRDVDDDGGDGDRARSRGDDDGGG